MTEVAVAHLLDPIPYEPDLASLMRRVRVKEGSPRAAELAELVEEARPLACPRALYMTSYIQERGEGFVVIEGVRFDSRVLGVNLANTYRVFPYLATCGQELQAWADRQEDMVHNYWAEAVKEQALRSALEAVYEHMLDHYQPGETASMSPGSLADWPITQQQVLFQLFGSYADAIGVCLTDSMLMIPTKSVSGIRFPNQDDFQSCQLCPREGCPGRRAVFDPELYDQKFCQHAG
jgi:hypothetical protein